MIPFWKEAVITATLAVMGEKLMIKSSRMPEAFLIIFASTIIGKYAADGLFTEDNRPYFGPERDPKGFTPAPKLYPHPTKI